ncbi:MAG: starch-binding protein, partial [Clostridia bacterium]|nr:starch-binding protein [Clostridia bacterium]
EDLDNLCDNCGAEVAHVDPTPDPEPDPDPECTEHVDEDLDNLCDNCGAEIAPVDPTPDPEPDPDPECTEHVDEDSDNLCDKCGAEVTPVDPTPDPEPDPDPECTEHVDEDLDNLCDKCGAEIAPVDPTPDPVDAYLLKGVDGDWAVGIQLSLNEGADEGKVEYMLQQVSIAAGTSVKINNPALELWVGAANVKDGVTVEYEADADGNILFLVEGKYDFYLDVTDAANPQLWIAAYVCPHVDEDLDGICDDCLAEMPQSDLYTVYFYNQDDWTTINAYAWTEGAGTNSSWPGVAMTAVEGQEGWYSIELNGFENIIFNNGSSQTADLTIDRENLHYAYGAWQNTFEVVEPELPEVDESMKVYKVVFSDSWATASGAKFYIWAWGSAQPDAWYEVTYTSGIYQVILPADATGCKLVRFDPSTAGLPTWDNGIWNQTGDMVPSGDTLTIKF